MARPTKYTKEQADAICDHVAEGEPLMPYCRAHGIAWRTVYHWLEDHKDFAERYAKAREVGFDAIAEDALEIANTPFEGEETTYGPTGTTIMRKDMLGHRKLQIWTRLQLLAKWSPQRYGDKLETTHKGGVAVGLILNGSDVRG